MVCRHLNIRFFETGDVEYNFFRHQSEFMLYRYLIEWPADQVDVIGGQCLEDHGFRRTITNEGFLLLEWDKVPETQTELGRGVDYIKRGYLKQLSGVPPLWRYCERFNIKPNFSILLHSPWERLNAIQRRSKAEFIGKEGREHYRPRELTNCVFCQKGVLQVDWTLELLDKPKRVW